MNNNLFISRCEVVVTTMRSGGVSNIISKKVAEWLQAEEHIAINVIAKMCSYNILKKIGAGRNTCYQLSDSFHNSLERSIASTNDIIKSVNSTINWFITYKSSIKVKELTTESGKKLTKIVSSEDIDEQSKLAVDYLLTVIKENTNLKEEVKLLREEVANLKKYEEYYKQVKGVKL